jgi:energy-coupling factor transporter ATP-binding protein EcfA2
MPLGPVTVLIGANGSGKSSVLESLGLEPVEEGARGRRHDQPAVVDWFMEPESGDDDSWRLLPLGSLSRPDLAKPVANTVRMIERHVVVRSGPEGPPDLWFDRFRTLDDRNKESRRRVVHETEKHLGSLKSLPWARCVLETLHDDTRAAPFIPLGIEVDVGLRPVKTVTMAAVPDDVTPLLLRGIEQLVHAVFCSVAEGDATVAGAIADFRSGYLLTADAAGILGPVLEAVGARANTLVPAFLARQGEIVVQLRQRPDGSIGEVEALLAEIATDAGPGAFDGRLDIARHLLRRAGDAIDAHLDAVVVRPSAPDLYYSRLGTGTRRWVYGCLDEALRELTEEWRDHPLNHDELHRLRGSGVLPKRRSVAAGHVVRLVDEPVESLEGRVHADIVHWLKARAASQPHTLVLSTHQASVMRTARPRELVVVGVRRDAHDLAAASIGPGLMAPMRAAFEDIGIGVEQLLFLTRAILLVEGADDLAILRAAYGERLEHHGVLLHAIGGNGWRSIVSALTNPAFTMLDIPAWVMLDSTPDDLLATSLRFVRTEATNDGDAVQVAGRRAGRPLRAIPFDAHDICLGVAPGVYRKAFESNQMPGNDQQVHLEWRHLESGAAAKEWLTKRLLPGAVRPNFSSKIIERVAAYIVESDLGADAASPWLASAMRRFFAELDAITLPVE